MAFAEHLITSLAEIPPLLATFAAEVGWDVASGPVLRHPDYEGGGPGGLAFSLTTASSGLNRDLIWSSTDPLVTSSAFIRSPILAAKNSPFTAYVPSPSRVFFVGMLTPEPYIAIVVEYGANLYRHLYLGFMEKIGDYSGGEVICGSGCMSVTANSNPDWFDRSANRFLFQANQSIRARGEAGGVHIGHIDNAVPWRQFRSSGSSGGSTGVDGSAFDGGEALGGFGDSVNDAYVAKGKSAIAGASLLVPVNLFASVKPTASLSRFISIGHPAGVRMVNIESMEPLSQVTIGSETWRIFAATRKSASLSLPRPAGAGGVYRLEESSYNLGYAYRSN